MDNSKREDVTFAEEGFKPFLYPPQINTDYITIRIEPGTHEREETVRNRAIEATAGVNEAESISDSVKDNFMLTVKDNGEIKLSDVISDTNGAKGYAYPLSETESAELKAIFDKKVGIDTDGIFDRRDEVIAEENDAGTPTVNAIMSFLDDNAYAKLAARTDLPDEYNINFASEFRSEILTDDNITMNVYVDYTETAVSVTLSVQNDYSGWKDYDVPITFGEEMKLREAFDKEYGKDGYTLDAAFDEIKEQNKTADKNVETR